MRLPNVLMVLRLLAQDTWQEAKEITETRGIKAITAIDGPVDGLVRQQGYINCPRRYAALSLRGLRNIIPVDSNVLN